MGCLRLEYIEQGLKADFSLFLEEAQEESTRTSKKCIDYFTFGMIMPGRNSNGTESTYRYAYNGMEADAAVKGERNSYTTEFRQYDPRLGRWLSLDPLMGMFPQMAPYVAFNNNPIYYIDPYGLEGGPKTKYDSGTSNGGVFCSTCSRQKIPTTHDRGGLTILKTLPQNPSTGDQYLYEFTDKYIYQFTYNSYNNNQWMVNKFRPTEIEGKEYILYASGSYLPWQGPRATLTYGTFQEAAPFGRLPLRPVTIIKNELAKELQPYTPRVTETGNGKVKPKLTDSDLRDAVMTKGTIFLNGVDPDKVTLSVNTAEDEHSGYQIGKDLSAYTYNGVEISMNIFLAENNTLQSVSKDKQSKAADKLAKDLEKQIRKGGAGGKISVTINFVNSPTLNRTFLKFN